MVGFMRNKKGQRPIYAIVISLLILIIGINLFLFFGKEKHQLLRPIEKNTVVKVINPIINIGRIKRWGKAEASFKIINIGYNPLIIEAVTVDCHCTSPSWERKAVNSNDSTIIKVKYDSSIPGFFQKKILVNVNSNNSPVLLIFRGEIIES